VEAVQKMLSIEKVKICFKWDSLLKLNDFDFVVYGEEEKIKTKEPYGIMGDTMLSKVA